MIRSIFGSLDLLRFLVARDLNLRYRRSMFGVAWTLAQPLPMALALYFVFRGSFGEPGGRYPLYVLTGVMFWTFFQNAVISGINGLQRQAGLIGHLPVPAGVFPAAAVLASTVHFVVSLSGLLVAMTLLGAPPRLAVIVLPLGIALTAAFALGVALVLAPMALLFSDVSEATTLVLALVGYLTPLFYPLSIVPEPYRSILAAGPLATLLACVRDPIQLGALPAAATAGLAVGWALAALAVGLVVFERMRKRIPFHV